MTLKSDSLSEFIIGEGYTICLVQNPHAKKSKLKSEIVNQSVHAFQDHSKSNNFMISSIPSISIAEAKKAARPKSPNNIAPAKTENLRDNHTRHQKVDSNTPSKPPNRSRSPYEYRSNSKSPVSKYVSPHLEHLRQKSLSNCKQKKELTKPALSPNKVDNQLNLFATQNQELL